MKSAKKTYLLPQSLINEVKRTFGVKTETEAIIRSMQEVSFRNHLVKWHSKNGGRLKIKNPYNFHGR